MKLIHKLIVVALSALLLCSSTNGDKTEYIKILQESIDKQEQVCMNLDGIWDFESYYLPNDGAPSRDLADDYIGTCLEISYKDGNILLEYGDNMYNMVYVRPLEKFYLRNGYAYSGGVEQKILNKYAYELLFEAPQRSMLLYINEQGELFLRILDSVAENACFVLERKYITENINIEGIMYFEELEEKLIEECKFHSRYNNLDRIVPMIGEYEDIFNGENAVLYKEKNTIKLEINGEKLELEDIAETMGLCTNFTFVWETECLEDEKALLYTFSNEKYNVQIMERSDGEQFIRIYFVDNNEYIVYHCVGIGDVT